MAEQQYTLTKKNTVRGPNDKDGKATYVHQKGDVINQKQFDALVGRHKDQFEKGALDLTKKQSKKDQAQDATLTDLQARVAKLEGEVFGDAKAGPDASETEDPEEKKTGVKK